jgi:hypothetical protein
MRNVKELEVSTLLASNSKMTDNQLIANKYRLRKPATPSQSSHPELLID